MNRIQPCDAVLPFLLPFGMFICTLININILYSTEQSQSILQIVFSLSIIHSCYNTKCDKAEAVECRNCTCMQY